MASSSDKKAEAHSPHGAGDVSSGAKFIKEEVRRLAENTFVYLVFTIKSEYSIYISVIIKRNR